MQITTCNLLKWVESAPSGQVEFREAVHTILTAITADLDLQKTMVMKGGLLMAIRYQSERFTTDLDFSSTLGRKELDTDEFRKRLEVSLARVVAESAEYDLDCRIQSFRISPKSERASFPNVQMSIGYAHKGTPKHQHLLRGQCPTKIDIDFNLNESILGIECLELGMDSNLQAYVFTDLIAEKFRSLLQQPSRNRYRRQDTYDLRLLIESKVSDEEKSQILESLKVKSEARNIFPQRDSLDNPEVRERAKRDYPRLADEITQELPKFEESYGIVTAFYRALPWDA